MKEEHVDGGFLVTMGTYTGPEDFNKQIVRQLQVRTTLPPANIEQLLTLFRLSGSSLHSGEDSMNLATNGPSRKSLLLPEAFPSRPLTRLLLRSSFHGRFRRALKGI